MAAADKDREEETVKSGEVSSTNELDSGVGPEATVEKTEKQEDNTSEDGETTEEASAPPLPDEAPPLPAELPPSIEPVDDGWAPVWDDTAQAFYFYNRFTAAAQWDNPRVPETVQPGPPGVEPKAAAPAGTPPTTAVTGYNPAIHGDYDPTAWYAQPAAVEEAPAKPQDQDPAAQYAASAAFNRFTGRFQADEIKPENYNDENKSKKQMNAFFDVDAAANSHDGRSLKAERSQKKLSKTELKQFKEKRKAKKEEKRRAWLLD
jgi:hypothetical protein